MSFKVVNRKGVVIHLLRIAVLGLLCGGYYLYLKELVSPPFWITAFLAGCCGAFFITPRFRFLPAVGLFGLILVAIRFSGFLIFSIMGESADLYYFLFDLNYLPLLLPLIISWLFSYWALRRPGFIKWEVILNGWLLFFLFFSQGKFELNLLPHPIYLAGGAALFLLFEIIILILTASSCGSDRKTILVFIFLLIMIISGGFIFFLGRYSKGAVSQGGGLVKPTLFRFDFSKYIKLESEITMSTDLVLLFREEEPSQQPLLRRFVLSGYKPESGFFMAEAPGEPPQIKTIPEEKITLPDPGWRDRNDSLQEYFLVNFDPTSLVAMNYPVEIIPLTNWDSSSFIRNYKVTSRISQFLTWELVDSDGADIPQDEHLNAKAFEFYTEYGEEQAIFDLAVQVTAGLENRFDQIMAILTYLQEDYFYSLKPGVSDDGNQLHHFLFESKKGYCSYFAFSMSLMCRSLGIPSRVAVGFFTDPELGVMNIYPVRADMAHAWVEVFFPGYGWINFDPTSQELAPGEDFQFGSLEVDEFLSLVEEILINRDGLGEEVPPEIDDMKPVPGWTFLLKESAGFIIKFWYLLILFIWLLLLLVIELSPRIRSFMSRNLNVRMDCELKLLVRRFALSGLNKKGDESLLEWAERADQAVHEASFSVREFADLYLKNRYGQEFSLEEYSIAREHRKMINGRLNQGITPGTCMNYLIRPFRRKR
ncbi:MAG: transglutaminase domain-containing protein [Spirochaetales bacterium]|nr:transglutaminase domain-containing protein [Spirochaetales bacterium]